MRETIYAFPARVTGDGEIGARAITSEGVIIAEAIGPIDQVKTDIVIAVQINRPDARIVWVDEPAKHPKIAHLADVPETVELAHPEDADAAVLQAMDALHDQYHLCGTCKLSTICKIAAAVETAPDAHVTISACLQFAKKEEIDDADETDGSSEEESS